MEDCNGLIFFGRQGAVDFADEFIFPSGQNILYQTVAAALSEGDKVDITFELKENEDEDLEDEGTTKAIFTDQTTGRKKVLWEVSNTSEGLREVQIERAYNAYRNALSTHLGVPPPLPLRGSETMTSEAESRTLISRALSPSNILQVSGASWYFVELSAVPTSSPEYRSASATLTRPMRAFDALILTSMITLAFGSPPLVFAIRPGMGRFGKMPQSFKRLKFQPKHVDEKENEGPDTFLYG
jgi:hypothetical protein